MSQIHLFAQQNAPGVSSEGNSVGARGTRDGIAFTSSWKESLVFEGRVHTFMVGTAEAGVVGGGAGTVIDQDQPEFGVSVPAGTALIPLDITIAFGTDLNAAAEVAQAMVIADTTAAYADDGTVTAETPVNLISSGGVTTVANAFSACTADITNPIESRLIAVQAWGATGATAGGGPGDFTLNYVAQVPQILIGPCAFYGFWGATGAATGWAKVTWAEVPAARYNL